MPEWAGKADKGAGNDLKTSSRQGRGVENRFWTHPLMLFGSSIASPGKNSGTTVKSLRGMRNAG